MLNQMITNMLDRDFHKRPIIAEVLKDPWMSSAAGDSDCVDKSALKRMSQMQEMTELQKGLLADMASRENLAQMEGLSETFASMDVDNDGLITPDEARTALKGHLPSD